MAVWETIRLDKIVSTNQSTYSPKEDWQFVNYLDTGNITMNRVDEIQYINTSTDKLPSRARRKVKLNSIIYSTVRPNQLHYGIIKEQLDNFLVSTGFAVIDVGFEKAVPDYIYYVLTQKEVTEHLQAIAEQSVSAYPSIKPSDIENLELLLPDRKTQEKIVAILSSIDKKIKQNNEINNNLDQQAQTLFKSWFVDFEPFNGTMPSDWEIVPLEKIADFQNGYAFKSKELLNEPSPDCYQVFKQGHIARSGGFVPDGTKSWYPKSLASKLEKFVLKKGDILMAMTDMKDNVAILGNTAVMPLDNEYIVNQRVGHLRTNGYKGVTYPFIYLLTNSTDFLVDLRSRANSGVQVNLSSSEIKASQTVLPSEEVNNAFSEITLPMFEIIINNQLENQRLAQLRDTLLPKLMSGELDVSDIDL